MASNISYSRKKTIVKKSLVGGAEQFAKIGIREYKALYSIATASGEISRYSTNEPLELIVQYAMAFNHTSLLPGLIIMNHDLSHGIADILRAWRVVY